MGIGNKHGLGNLSSLHMAQVIDNTDPENSGRIKVLLLANDMEIWANVIVPSAGQGYGFACIPKVEEIVAVAFLSHDQACVLGSLWTGSDSVPSDADAVEDHYLVQTPRGTILEFDDNDGPTFEVRTESGYKITIKEDGGGSINIKRGGQSIKLSSTEVKVSGTKIVLDASTIEMSASMVTVNSAISQFSGVVQSDVLISNSVVGTSYTPGAGNIW
jgi:phage baseplate assembly protein gpV